MTLTRWWNSSLPQTLQIAVVLLYVDALFGVLGATVGAFPLGTALVVGAAAGGLGIANEKRWGWALGVAVSAAWVALRLLALRSADVDLIDIAFSLLFPVAQLGLLLHPRSRDHQKVWFT